MRWARVIFPVLICAFLAGPASAAPPEVKDDAGFFSAAAVSQANTAIQDIKRIYKKDLHVETFAAVPANLQPKFQKDKTKFFTDWSAGRAGLLKLEGVYVQICKEPPHLEVFVTDATLKKGFVVADRNKLRDVLVARFKEKAFDQGLAATVALVRDRFEANLGPAIPGPVANVVQDHASFFSPQTVTRTNQEIKEFQERFKKNLIIETFATPPPAQRKLLENADAETRNKVFAEWVHQRAQGAKGDSIHVLICKEPARIQIEASEAVLKKTLTAKDHDELRNVFVSHFQAKEFDKGLAAALDHLYDTVDRNVTPPLPSPVAGTILAQSKDEENER